MAELFADLDKDGSGTLERAEVAELCKRMGLSLGRSGVLDVSSVRSVW